MTSPQTRQALIIAAGAGSRIQTDRQLLPKPLVKVGGLMLIERAILSCERAGLEECVVVLGYEAGQIRAALNKKSFKIKVTIVENPDWRRSNGLSVLAAAPHLDPQFFLLMADHIFEARLLAQLAETPLAGDDALLCVDRHLDKVFDLDDATKVALKNDRIVAIGKNLRHYQAADCGLFLLTTAFLDALQASRHGEDCSVSDGVKYLAERGRMRAVDVSGCFWQDVDTPPAKKHAEKILLNACRKPTDGVVSRHFNRHISLFVTRMVMNTRMSANQMTGITSLIGVFSGLMMALGTYWASVVGVVLFKLSSIMDGCDGELSKLKLTESKLGQWLDTASDNATYIVFLLGVMIGLFKAGHPHALLLSLTTLIGLFATLGIMVSFLVKKGQSGSLLAVQKFITSQSADQPKRWYSQITRVHFFMKRDLFSVIFLLLTVFKMTPTILVLTTIGTNLCWIVLLSARVVEVRTAHQLKLKEDELFL